MSEDGIEVEVKFELQTLDALRAQLVELSAILTQSRHLERNILFDDENGSLITQGAVLRLRSALDNWITLKTRLSQTGDQHKVRAELETRVEDFDAMQTILNALGYKEVWRYEKYRESFRVGDVIVSLDHTPIGNFVELEGPPDALRPLAERLGFDWTMRDLHSYRELFRARALPGQQHMVFDTSG